MVGSPDRSPRRRCARRASTRSSSRTTRRARTTSARSSRSCTTAWTPYGRSTPSASWWTTRSPPTGWTSTPVTGLLSENRWSDGITGPRTLRRADLYRALHDELRRQGIAVEHGKRLVGLADGVRAVFADGTTAEGDLLVGADGLHSATRRLIDPDAPEPRYTGLNIFYGYAEGLGPTTAPGRYHMIAGSRGFSGTAPRRTARRGGSPGPRVRSGTGAHPPSTASTPPRSSPTTSRSRARSSRPRGRSTRATPTTSRPRPCGTPTGWCWSGTRHTPRPRQRVRVRRWRWRTASPSRGACATWRRRAGVRGVRAVAPGTGGSAGGDERRVGREPVGIGEFFLRAPHRVE